MKPLVRLEQADLDVNQSLDHYLANEPHVASRFLDALEKAYVHIQRHPGIGSPRYAHALDIEGLRFWLASPFSQIVFYIERDDHIVLIRILHSSRDVPASFQDQSGLSNN